MKNGSDDYWREQIAAGDRTALSSARGVARNRASARLICRHPDEFEALWAEEAVKLTTTPGRFNGIREFAETEQEREARLLSEEITRNKLEHTVAMALLDVLT